MRFFMAGLLGLAATVAIAAPMPGDWPVQLTRARPEGNTLDRPKTYNDMNNSPTYRRPQFNYNQPSSSYSVGKSNLVYRPTVPDRRITNNRALPSNDQEAPGNQMPPTSNNYAYTGRTATPDRGVTEDSIEEDDWGFPDYVARGVFSGNCIVACGGKVDKNPVQVASNCSGPSCQVPKTYQFAHQCWEAECKKDASYKGKDRLDFP